MLRLLNSREKRTLNEIGIPAKETDMLLYGNDGNAEYIVDLKTGGGYEVPFNLDSFFKKSPVISCCLKE